MSILENYIKENFKGILVFGDIHSDYKSLIKAYKFAEDNDYFFMSLGDLVDRGPFPFETILHMHSFMKNGNAGFTIGNHDDKFHRFYNGVKVTFSADAGKTLIDVGHERQEEFLKMYAEIIETPIYSNIYHILDDIILVHAASHVCMWDSSVKLDIEARSRALYGEINGKRRTDGSPVRLYNWIEEIPTDKIVIVGHDRSPIYDISITEPMIKINNNGGRVIFIDTGCGKGRFLTGAVITHDMAHFKFDRFVDFR